MLQYNTHKLLHIDDNPTSKSDEGGDVSGRTDMISPGLHTVRTTPRRYGYLRMLNRTNIEHVPDPQNVAETNLAAVSPCFFFVCFVLLIFRA